MTGDNSQPRKTKTDWDRLESFAASDESSPPENGGLMSRRTTEVVSATTTGVPSPLATIKQEAPQGILTQLKLGRIEREAAVDKCRQWFDYERKLFQEKLDAALLTEKARIAVMVAQYQEKIESERMEVINAFGLTNKKKLINSLFQLHQLIADAVKEADKQDWPERLVKDTINRLWQLDARGTEELFQNCRAANA